MSTPPDPRVSTRGRADGPRRRTPPRRMHARRGSDRRTQILGAAAALFAERGFHGVSVDDIGARTGTTGPALYRHFRSKEDVLAELLVGVSERLLDGGLRRVRAPRQPARALDELIAFHVEFALDDPDVITVQERDLANLPERARRAVRALQHRYVGVWTDVVEAVTGCPRASAAAATHAAFGLMNSTPHSARLPRPEMAALLRAMARAAIEGACPGSQGAGIATRGTGTRGSSPNGTGAHGAQEASRGTRKA